VVSFEVRGPVQATGLSDTPSRKRIFAATFQLIGHERGLKLINLLTGDHSEASARGRHRIVMEPYGYHWYRMGGLGYLFDRTDV